MSDIRYGDWTPQTEVITERIDATQARKLAATLDRSEDGIEDGAPLPAMYHWVYFLPRAPMSKIGTDGHPERGGFFPPVELQRRMFAGARTKFLKPLLIGQEATRTGTITSLAEKEGKAGRMVLATAEYTIEQGGETCITDTHDIIYIAGGGQTPAPGPDSWTAPADGWHRTVHVDGVMLFRYSALIFNGHRIHYDREYTRDEEGYPGLVVTGPLTATLLAQFAADNAGHEFAGFSFRGRAPLFDFAPFHLVGDVEGDTAEVSAQRSDGVTAMTATAEFAA
ncbi:MAG: MaoC family dehydratase N-terminal domain-containing protein [Rhodospirillaceae bacterium]